MPVDSFDAAAVYSHLSPKAAVLALRQALADGFDPAADTPRQAVELPGGEFLLMASATGGSFGIKLLSVADPEQRPDVPRIQGTYVLFDGATLAPRAFIDGIAITNRRTAAVSLAGVYGFFDKSGGTPLNVVIFGTGAQGRAHAEAAHSAFDGRAVSVTHLSRTRPADLDNWAEAGSPAADAALRAADLIICATTASEPILHAAQVPADAVVVAVGSHSPHAREVAPDVVAAAHVIVEDPATTLREGGDVIQAIAEGACTPDRLHAMADVVAGRTTLERDRPIFFKFTGMSWEDLVLAERVADAAGS